MYRTAAALVIIMTKILDIEVNLFVMQSNQIKDLSFDKIYRF